MMAVWLNGPSSRSNHIDMVAGGAMTEIRGGAETILVVDDQGDFGRLVERMLHSLGYTVIVSNHGGDALRQYDASADDIDLVITDVQMPQISGPELAAALRQRRRNVRVLFMSGHSKQALAGYGGIGAESPYLRKPFSLEDIAQQVRRALEGVQEMAWAEATPATEYGSS
jgi:hypothetical protein